MTLAKAVELAKAEKKKPGQKNIRFVICHSPMEVKAGENRDFDGAPDNPEEDYGYCPEEAKDILFRFGTVVATV